jgi:hypothetical protein
MPSEVRKLTLRQAKDILTEMNEEFKANARIQGATVKDDTEVREATSSDIAMLMAFTGKT